MATNHRHLNVSPERVFEVLMDTGVYADWVVGAHKIRDTDRAWPAVGSRFHHQVGVGPFKLNDHTEVIEIDPPRKLVLHARARPMGTAIVGLVLEESDAGTSVTMTETAGDLLSHLAINALTDWLVHIRNTESLRRLARIAESGVVKT
jgi:uncharacterized protein YndB with AHSA1/START domain